MTSSADVPIPRPVRGLVFVLVVWNLIVVAIYGLDKWAAKTNSRRIRESTLLACAFGFGALGALVGMQLFRHKTQKLVFTLLVPFALLVNVVLTFLFVTR